LYLPILLGSEDPVGCCGFINPKMLKYFHINNTETKKRAEMLQWYESYLNKNVPIPSARQKHEEILAVETIQSLERVLIQLQQSHQRLMKRQQALLEENRQLWEKVEQQEKTILMLKRKYNIVDKDNE
jgi:hypothetical protein